MPLKVDRTVVEDFVRFVTQGPRGDDLRVLFAKFEDAPDAEWCAAFTRLFVMLRTYIQLDQIEAGMAVPKTERVKRRRNVRCR